MVTDKFYIDQKPVEKLITVESTKKNQISEYAISWIWTLNKNIT